VFSIFSFFYSSFSLCFGGACFPPLIGGGVFLGSDLVAGGFFTGAGEGIGAFF